MKKLLGCALALMMLTACGSKDEGGNSAAKETKKCTVAMSGMDIEFNVTGADDTAETIEIVYTLPLKSMGATEDVIANITQEQLDEIGKQAMKQQGIKEGDGIDAKFKLEDSNLVMTMTVDLKEGNADALESSFGIKGDQKISEIVAGMEAGGATCK